MRFVNQNRHLIPKTIQDDRAFIPYFKETKKTDFSSISTPKYALPGDRNETKPPEISPIGNPLAPPFPKTCPRSDLHEAHHEPALMAHPKDTLTSLERSEYRNFNRA